MPVEVEVYESNKRQSGARQLCAKMPNIIKRAGLGDEVEVRFVQGGQYDVTDYDVKIKITTNTPSKPLARETAGKINKAVRKELPEWATSSLMIKAI